MATFLAPPLVQVSLCVTMINLSLLFCLGEPQR